MRRSMFVLSAVLFSVAGCTSSPVELELTPDVLTARQVIVAGETVRLEAKLLNPERHRVFILGTKSSCGCTAVKVAGRADISPQKPLETTETELPVEIVVDTRMKGGATSYEVAIAYSDGSMAEPGWARARAELDVFCGLLVAPKAIVFSEAEIGEETTVRISTDVADMALELDRIEVSDPTLIRAKLVPGKLGGASDQQVEVTYLGTQGNRKLPAHARVTIFAHDSRLSPIDVPVRIDPTREEASLIPPRLTLTLADEEREPVREVRLNTSEDCATLPTLHYPESLCRASIERKDARSFAASVQCLPAAAGQSFVVHIQVGERTLKLPVSVLAPSIRGPNTNR